jgi:hypothetical protein
VAAVQSDKRLSVALDVGAEALDVHVIDLAYAALLDHNVGAGMRRIRCFLGRGLMTKQLALTSTAAAMSHLCLLTQTSRGQKCTGTRRVNGVSAVAHQHCGLQTSNVLLLHTGGQWSRPGRVAAQNHCLHRLTAVAQAALALELRHAINSRPGVPLKQRRGHPALSADLVPTNGIIDINQFDTAWRLVRIGCPVESIASLHIAQNVTARQLE